MKFLYIIFFLLTSLINFTSFFNINYDPNEADLLGRISAAISSKYYHECLSNDEILKNNTEMLFSYSRHDSKLNGDFLFAIIRLKYDSESIVIVHKSTSTTKQLISQGIYALLPKEQFLNSGKVYLYPMKAINITYTVMSTKLKEILNNSSYKNVIFTGHSLGGSLAVLDSYRCIYENICSSNTTKVVTFGAPYTYRVVVKDDLVPTIPMCESVFWENSCRNCGKTWFDLYYHVGTEIYYNNDTSGNYTICQQYIEDINCSSKVFSWLNFPKYLFNSQYYLKKHTTYFETVYNQTYNETKCDFYIN
uniref:Lipase_3 domain-containing protein n=1 Tax=Strongyloides stercoralis TaxID=6248 RepID=A0A913IEA4_STRER